MATCFVIQPFDGAVFDKRYRDIIKPAIEAAGLEAYRVDEDPTVDIPIDDIERGIREAAVCLAEITTNNPNVWFELGFAIAARKEVVLICSDQRDSKFPFDVQHRSIITYKTDSLQDYISLREKITERVSALLQKEERLTQVMSPIAPVAGLSQHEIVALVSVAENLESPSDTVGAFVIRQDMERLGFTKIASFIALAGLVRKRMVEEREDSDINGNSFMLYRLTEAGTEWIIRNQDKLVLWEKPKPVKLENPFQLGPEPDEDDIPF
jgi:hypothetical protein